MKSCRGRHFGCITEHLCIKPYTAVTLSEDMIELFKTVGCSAFESKDGEL